MNTTSQATMSLLPEDANAYYELWLRGDGRTHDRATIDAFARAHPAMSGRKVDVFERGYRSWLDSAGIADSAPAFAEYIAPRYRRWRNAVLRNEVIGLLATLRRGKTLAA